MQKLFTTRFGGVSQVPFDSLNVGLHVNDNALHVKENRAILKKQLGVSNLVFMNQVHGDEVVVVSKGDEYPSCDALICAQEDIGLVVMVADCIPILFYDRVRHIIGVAHAGRAGSALHVGQKTIAKMQEVFGSKIEDMQVFMGPSIQKCCYEVGIEATVGLEKCLHVKHGRYFLDLQSANKEDFLALGIREEAIEISPICTCCDKDYFSYRRDKTTGRFCGVITL
ncbi:MAG: peptidoglycan editing factor PgeF [Campylobacteraceae bacterium]|nr:peptidoglycan editing factor PgeF [Campylobacteraceae bacterium]